MNHRILVSQINSHHCKLNHHEPAKTSIVEAMAHFQDLPIENGDVPDLC